MRRIKNNTNMSLLLNGTPNKIIIILLLFSLCFLSSFAQESPFTFTTTEIPLPSLTNSFVSTGDFDNTGIMKLYLSGKVNSRDYKNYFYSYLGTGYSIYPVETSGLCYRYGSNGSSDFGDYDNDGDLDLLISGVAQAGRDGNCGSDTTATYNITKLLKYSGGSFSPVVDFYGIRDGVAVFGDYNNDGYLDVLVSGSGVSKLYKNNGGSFSEVTTSTFVGVSGAKSTFADYDNDGDLDIFILGTYSNLYKNNGKTSFSVVTTANLPGFTAGSANVGDYDADGYPDVFITGYSGGIFSKLYKNNKGTGFENVYNGTFSPVYYSNSHMADYDNDGDLDIFLSGRKSITNDTTVSYLYKNKGTSFSERISFKGTESGASGSIDYDNDGDLDLVIIDKRFSGVFTNNTIVNRSALANTPPSTPHSLTFSISSQNVTLSWNTSVDDKTPAPALSYNVFIGTSTEPEKFRVSETHIKNTYSSRRKVVKQGAIKDTFLLGKFIPGIYYCGVQAIDNSFAGSNWRYNIFKISPLLYPATNITTNSFTISWKKSLSSTYYYDIALDKNFTILVANNIFASDTLAVVTNMKPGNTYYARVKNSNGVETTDYSNTIEVHILPQFTRMTGAGYSFQGVYRGSSQFVDIDNDNDLDLFITGYINSVPLNVSQFYKNNRTGFELSTTLTVDNVQYSESIFGDYNNDGYVDLFLSGYNEIGSGGSKVSYLYRNNSGTSFTALTTSAFAFTATFATTASFIDYDGDGYLDLVFSGSTSDIYASGSANYWVSKVYKNNSGTSFSQIMNFSTPFLYGASGKGDIDNDGDLDIMFSGTTSGGKIYINTKSVFNELAGISFSNVEPSYGLRSKNVLSDIDNDDDLDILYTSTNGITLYINNNTSFSMNAVFPSPAKAWSGDFVDLNGDTFMDVVSVSYPVSISPASGIRNKLYWSKNTGTGFNHYILDTGSLNINNVSTAFGDYDADGDIDMFVSGFRRTTVGTSVTYERISRIYRNENINSNGTINENTRPNAPTNPIAINFGKNQIQFRWNASADANQSSQSLSYNIYAGDGVNSENIAPSESFLNGNLNGKRKTPAYGNIRNTYHNISTLGISPGFYSWGVQAVDNSFAGSTFATSYFSIRPRAFLIQNDSGKYIATWNKVKGATSYRIEISNNKNFSPTFFNSSLTDTSLRVSPILTEMRDYYYRVNATNGTYTTSYSDTVTMGYVRFAKAFTFPGYVRATTSFGDYDKDGDLDVFLAGGNGYNNGNKSALYKNQSGNFIEQTGSAFSFGAIFEGISNFVDYDNDGDLDLHVSGEYTGDVSVSGDWLYWDYIYKNNGNGFEKKNFSNPCYVKYLKRKRNNFLDYNNDGNTDYFENAQMQHTCAGASSVFDYPVLFRNTNGSFEQLLGSMFLNNNSILVQYSSNTFLDFNNDGKTDILFTGNLIKNSGNNSDVFYSYSYDNISQNFQKQTNSFVPMSYGTISVGDYNNDGYEDMFTAGATSLTKTIYYPQASYLYTNRGDGTLNFSVDNKGGNFSDPLEDTYGDSDFGDYDNDGDLDLLVAGTRDGNILYRNDNNSFIKIYTLPGREMSSGAFFDYDNDGDLDMILSGSSSTSIYKNTLGTNAYVPNTRPKAPTGLTILLDTSKRITFRWNKATDAQTPSDALNYNIYCGTKFSKELVISSQSTISSDSTLDGKRKVIQKGRIQKNEYTFRDSLPPGIYYWSVQAIDQAFEGSRWASKQYFIIPPKIVSTGLIVNSGFLPYVTFTPMNGFPPPAGNTRENPYYTLEVAEDSTFQNIYPTDGTTYNCCYSNDIYTNPGVTHTNRISVYRRQEFLPGRKYYARVKASDSLHTVYTPYVVFERPIGLEKIQTGITATAIGSSLFGDYDNDGDLDYFISGSTGSSGIAKLYRNDRGSFTPLTSSTYTFEGVVNSSSNFVDYDNDGDLDIFVTGQSSGGRTETMYRNEGSGFTKFPYNNLGLGRVFRSSSDFGDYDNDGYLDVLITGRDAGDSTTAILYKNNNGTAFQSLSYSFVGVEWGSGNFVDYDNDGDLDIFISGKNQTGNGVTKLYKNNQTAFSEATEFSFAQLYNSSVSIGDYDNDSDRDIFLSGTDGTNLYSYLYKNNITSFTPIRNFTNVHYSSSKIEDFDGDGDIDILSSGLYSNTPYSVLYNNEDGFFTPQTTFTSGKKIYGGTSSASQINLLPIFQGHNNMADYDNDGDMDVIISGSTAVTFPIGSVSSAYLNLEFYRNGKRNILDTNTYSRNKIPLTPTGLNSSLINSQKVILSWNPSTDSTINGTKENVIYYDLSIGTKENKISVKSPASLPSGKRLVGETGNIITPFFALNTSSFTKPKVYYWKVQSIDGSKSGSYWSREDSFILKDNQSLYAAGISPKKYLDVFELNTSSNSSIPVVYTFDTSYLRVTNGSFSIKKVGIGSTTISVMQPGNDYYYPSTSINKTIFISKKEQTIDFSQPFLREYGDIIELVPTASSGLPVTYFTSSPSKAFISNNRIITNSSGTVTITAIQIGNENYLPLTTLSRVLTINRRGQTISFDAFSSSKTYGEDPFQLSISSTSPLPITYTLLPPGIVFIYNDVVNILSAGTVSIIAKQEENNYYLKADSVVRKLIIHKATQSINFSNTHIFKTVGDPNFSLNYNASSGIPITYSLSNTNVCTVNQNIFTVRESGIATIYINQLGNANYFPAYASQRIIVIDRGKGSQNINFHPIPEKTFGDPPFSLLSRTNSGLSVSYYSENTSIASIKKDTLTILQAGETTITAIQTGDTYYNPQFVSQTIRIQKATPPVYFDEIPLKTFGSAPFILSAYSYPRLPIFYSSSLTNILEIKKDTAIIKNTGIVSIFAFQTGNTNYNPSQSMRLVRIDDASKNSQTITFFSIPTKIYGDNPFLLQAINTTLLGITYISFNTSVATLSSNIVTIRGTGTCLISAYSIGNNRYNPSNIAYQILTVEKANQTIILNPITERLDIDPPFTVFATTTSGLPIRYSVSNTEVVSLVGNTVTINAPGVTSLTAFQIGNNFYKPQSVSQNIVINSISRQPQTITFISIPEKIMGDAPFKLFATTTSSLPITFISSDSSIASIKNDSVTIHTNGQVTITAYQYGSVSFNAASQNKTLTIKLTQTITFQPIVSKTFGDHNFEINTSSSSFLPINYSFSNPSIVSITNNVLTILGAGTTLITASQNGNNTYKQAQSISQILKIEKTTQTITFDTITSKYIDDEPFEIFATTTSNLPITFIPSNPEVVQITGENYISIIKGGTITITATQIGNNNYKPAIPVSQKFIISKRNQIIVFSQLPAKRYLEETSFPINAYATSSLPIRFVSSQESVAVIDEQLVILKTPGTTIISAYQEGNNAYNPAPRVSRTLLINKATQIINFPNLPIKTIGEPSFLLTATISSPLPIRYLSSKPGVASLFDDVVFINETGTTIITAYQEGDSIYNPASPIQQILSIISQEEAKPQLEGIEQHITFNPIPTKDINSPSFVLYASASSELPVSFKSSNTQIIRIYNDSVTIYRPGQTTITAYQLGNKKYKYAPPISRQLIISDPQKQEQTISFEPISQKTLGDKPFTILAYTTSSLPITFISSDTLKIIIHGNTANIVGGGIVYITALQKGNEQYNPATPIEQKISIIDPSKKNQIITFDPIPPKITKSTPFLLDATATSGFSVSYQITNSSIADISLRNVTIKKVGTTFITAYQEGNEEFNPAEPISQILTVSNPEDTTILIPTKKINQSINFPLPDFVTQGIDKFFILKASATSQLPITYITPDTAFIKITNNIATLKNIEFTITTPQTITITASQSGNSTYNPAPIVSRLTLIKPNPLTYIQNNNDNHIKIYPNPAKDILNIEIDKNVKPSKYQLIDIKGNIIIQAFFQNQNKSISKIDIKKIKPGEYILIISDQNKTTITIQKIIIY